jgi:hypothetical protein
MTARAGAPARKLRFPKLSSMPTRFNARRIIPTGRKYDTAHGPVPCVPPHEPLPNRETLKGIFSPFCRVPANYRSCDPETEGSCTMLNYAKAGLAGLALLSSAEVSLPL